MDKESQILGYIFNNVNKWLEFSEKKNTYVFSFFSLMIIFTPFIGKLTNLSLLLKISTSIFYFFYIITITITVLSLFPKTDISEKIVKKGRDKKITENDNLLFFGDISKYSVVEYKNALAKKYKMSETLDAYKDDLVTQIIINSNIANTKLVYFKISVKLLCLAMVQFAICLSISFFL
jgi:hypothetical protein